MPRSLLPPAMLLLTIVTAVTLVAAALSIRPAGPAAPLGTTDATNRAALWRFYEAVNDVIATGDTEPLTSVLSPDYVEPDDTGALVAGRAALERSLHALHATVPTLRLDIERLANDRDHVIAVVKTHGVEGNAALGLTLVDPQWWSPLEVFRVVDGRIAARTSLGERPLLWETLVRAPVELPPSARPVATAVRVTLAPGDWRRVPGVAAFRLIVAEAGSFHVTITKGGQPPALPDSDSVMLGAGDWLVVPAVNDDSVGYGGYAARNPGPEPAVFVEVLIAASITLRGAEAFPSDDAASQILAGGQKVSIPAAPVELTIGRVTLAPGGRLAWTAPAGPVLLWVDGGTLALTPDEEGYAWVHRRTDGSERYLPIASLAAGDGALLDMGTGVQIRNAGDAPLEVLVVTLLGAPGDLTLPSAPSRTLPPPPGLVGNRI